MRIVEITYGKRQMAADHARVLRDDGSNTAQHLRAEIERIFKWKCAINQQDPALSSRRAKWTLRFTVPDGTTADEFSFTEGMLKRKLPSLAHKYLSPTAEIGQFGYLYPNLKALPYQTPEFGVPPVLLVTIT